MKIQIKGLYKSIRLSNGRRHHIFSDLNLTIDPGSLTVILGESGCGKSTLLNMIAGLSRPCCGEILADGRPVKGPHPSRSLLFQNPSLLPWLTVKDNIAFGCRIRNDRHHLNQRVLHLIEMMGLTDFANAYPYELSVGMIQRAYLAITLLAHPKLLLLDEPFSSLDTFNRTHLQQEVVKIWQQKKFTVILITHDLDEAIALGQRVIFLGGHPCRPQNVYDIELPYPRDITSTVFTKFRNNIIAELRENYLGR